MDIKELFDKAEGGTLTYEQFQAASKEGKANFVDLAEGKYVSLNKYNDEISSRDTQIETLNNTIGARDTDLATLKQQLEGIGNDTSKLDALNTQLSDLQSKYDTDTKNYQAQLSKQAYEFAVREFAATKDFTSNAAKRDFINSMIGKNLVMENGKIMGAEDFVTSYTEANADAFVVKKEEPPAPTPNPAIPQFVQPTPGPTPGNDSGFSFNFTGVRPKEQ